MKKIFILSLLMAFVSTLAISQVATRQNPKGVENAKWTNVQQGTVSTSIATTAPANIRVTGDNCTDPFMVTSIPSTVTGTAIEGFTNVYGTVLTTPWGYDGADVVYSYTAAANINLSVTITGNWDQALAVFTDCADPVTSQLAETADGNYTAPFTEALIFAVTTGTTYYIVAAAYEPTATGAWSLVIEEEVPCVDVLVPAGVSEIEPNGGINESPVQYDPRTPGTEAAPTLITGTLETVAGARDMDWFNMSLTAGDNVHCVVDIACGDVVVFFGNATMSYYVYANANGEETGEELVFSCDTTGNYWMVIAPPDFNDRPLFGYNAQLWIGDIIVNPGEGETFEGVFPPAGWSIVDNDGDTYNWYKADTLLAAHGGIAIATSASYINDPGAALTPDNWLITSQIENVDAAQSVSWWVAAQDPAWAGDKYAVMISTATAALSDFTITLHEETLSSAVFEQHVYDLSAYEGQSIYIAFRHYDCTDMFQLKLDDVVLPESNNGINPLSGTNVQIFPNPATDVLNISNAANTTIVIYNVVGEVVTSIENAEVLNTISLADFENGTYIVKIMSEGSVYNRKFVVNK